MKWDGSHIDNLISLDMVIMLLLEIDTEPVELTHIGHSTVDKVQAKLTD